MAIKTLNSYIKGSSEFNNSNLNDIFSGKDWFFITNFTFSLQILLFKGKNGEFLKVFKKKNQRILVKIVKNSVLNTNLDPQRICFKNPVFRD